MVIPFAVVLLKLQDPLIFPGGNVHTLFVFGVLVGHQTGSGVVGVETGTGTMVGTSPRYGC